MSGVVAPSPDRVRSDQLMARSVRGKRVSVIDRQWSAAAVQVVVGPLHLPPRDELVGALRKLAEHQAVTRVGWLRAAGQSRWSLAADLDSFAETAVIDFPGLDELDPGEALAAVRTIDRGPLPFVLYVGRHRLILSISHSLGDGFFMTRLIAGLLETARTGVVPAWTLRAPVDHPLAAGGWLIFGRHPRRVAKLWRDRVPPAAPVAPPGENTGWQPDLECCYGFVAPNQMALLKRWRVTNTPGVSLVPVSIAATEVALQQLGIPVHPQPLVLFDARRYLAGRATDVGGNFSAGLRMTFADPGDPRSVDTALKAAAADGRPLAVLGISALRNIRPAPAVASVDGSGRWDIAYSHMGRPIDSSRFAWSAVDGRGREYFGLLEPAAPHAVTVGFTEIDRRLTMFCSFHANVVDPARVQALVDLVCADPVALLESARHQNQRRDTEQHEIHTQRKETTHG